MKITQLLAIAIYLTSCSSPTEKKNTTTTIHEAPPTEQKENFKTGILIDKITCKADTSQSYALYLPSSHSLDKKYPVMFAFDPHGTGKIPLAKYQELAEKYNFILVGSNNSKNGKSWEEIQKITNTLFADVQSRLNTDAQRIYLLGFSGGARIANGIAMNNGSITGVICCGAAAPASGGKNPRANYFFMGIAGNEDLNYVEVRKYDKVEMAGHSAKHALLEFNGKHEWPPLATMNQAFWWMELNKMRTMNAPEKDPRIKDSVQVANEELKTFVAKQQSMKAYECCRKTINFYDGLADLSFFFETYKSLQNNKAVDVALKKEEQDWKQEEKLKMLYRDAIQFKDYPWWSKDISSLNSKIKSAPIDEALIYKRVLSYLSLVMYMQAAQFIEQRNIPAAVHFSKLYLLVDPTNAEASYLAAELNASQGNEAESIRYLKNAIDNGFIDKARLETDNAFVSLKGNPEFEKIKEKIAGR